MPSSFGEFIQVVMIDDYCVGGLLACLAFLRVKEESFGT